MTPMLSGHFSIFGLVFLVLKSLLGIARQWSHVKFAFMTLKPRSCVIFFLLLFFSGNCETMESCKICIYDPKASELCYFKYIELGPFPTDTAPYIIVSLVTKPSSLVT